MCECFFSSGATNNQLFSRWVHTQVDLYNYKRHVYTTEAIDITISNSWCDWPWLVINLINVSFCRYFSTIFRILSPNLNPFYES